DVRLSDALAALQPVPQPLKGDLRRVHARRLAGDRHPVAPARHAHAERLLEADQMTVMVAEQKWQKRVVVELEGDGLPSGRAGQGGSGGGGRGEVGQAEARS